MKSNAVNMEPGQARSSVGSTINYIKDLLIAGPEGPTGKGLEMGVGAVLARTVLKRLPVPLNYIAPFLVEKVIMKYGVEEGRDIILKGLYWVKKVTDEKPRVQSF